MSAVEAVSSLVFPCETRSTALGVYAHVVNGRCGMPQGGDDSSATVTVSLQYLVGGCLIAVLL
jgi:hypothetical protein